MLTWYDQAFRKLCAFSKLRGIDPLSLSVHEIAGHIQAMCNLSASEARHAYSALLLIPGFEYLRFSPLRKQCKRVWNVSRPKYADFWDASLAFKKLQQQCLDWNSVAQIRNRLIMVLRLLHLCRSVDLAQTWRTISHSSSNEVYILIQRKGATFPSWEKLLCLPLKEVCPVALILRYVHMTSHLPAGSLLLTALKPPFAPLTPNSIGRVSKQILAQLGVPIKAFGPHSTRGAGVKMYKSLGLSSEYVCELGKWKNPTAFTAHYLRLGATEVAAQALSPLLVHTVSSSRSAEPDRSSSPRTNLDLGRIDLEGEAQREDET